MYVCMYVCMYGIYIYIYMYVCMYAFIGFCSLSLQDLAGFAQGFTQRLMGLALGFYRLGWRFLRWACRPLDHSHLKERDQ